MKVLMDNMVQEQNIHSGGKVPKCSVHRSSETNGFRGMWVGSSSRTQGEIGKIRVGRLHQATFPKVRGTKFSWNLTNGRKHPNKDGIVPTLISELEAVGLPLVLIKVKNAFVNKVLTRGRTSRDLVSCASVNR
jgi:hypothetical protein